METLTSIVQVPQWYLAAIGVVGILVSMIAFLIVSWFWQRYALQRIAAGQGEGAVLKLSAPTLKDGNKKSTEKKEQEKAKDTTSQFVPRTEPVAKPINVPDTVLHRDGPVTVKKVPPTPSVTLSANPPLPPASEEEEPEPEVAEEPSIETMSIAEAAKRTKLAKSTIREYIRTERLEAEMVNSIWRIPVASVKQLMKGRSKNR